MTQPTIDGVGHGIPRMCFFSDGTKWYAALIDSAGHLQIDVVSYPGSNAFGNIPFGYQDRYLERKEATSVNGHTYVDGSTVPSGEVWIVTSFTGYHDDPTARIIRQYIYDGTARLIVDLKESAGQWIPYSPPKTYVLKAGDYLSVRADSLATGCKVYLTANGYKMKVA